MAVTRFRYFEDPSPVIGKADFEWFYSGTLQKNDDNKIPVKTKIIDVYINRLDVVLYSAPQGDVTNGRVVVNFYKNGSLIDTVIIAPGGLTGTTTIAKTLVTAGDKMTATITSVGTTTLAITASMYARVTT